MDAPAMTAAAPVTNVSIIQLPESASPNSLSKSSRYNSANVTVKNGGDVPVTKWGYSTKFGGYVVITMNLHFEPGTVKEDVNIAINLDTQNLTADFTPSGLEFNKPAILSASVSGLLGSSIPQGSDVGLYYINGGQYEKMAGSVSISRWGGLINLTLTDGQIPHFSLYGFGFTK